jgi:DNA-binding CsgD family transcriptional regulator
MVHRRSRRTPRIVGTTTSKSDLLRVQDVRDAYRLIGECRDLASDPLRWQTRLLEGLCGLIGAPVAAGGEGVLVQPNGGIRAVTGFGAGFDVAGQKILMSFMRDVGPAGCPFMSALARLPGSVVTRTRVQLVSDRVWCRSRSFDYHRRGHIEGNLASYYWTGAGAVSAIDLGRAAGEPEFTPRQQRLLEFFHAELGPLIGRALVSATEPDPERLAPRLRQTLVCLLQGDSEKQVAARLELSHATVHQYVTALYRHYKVQSRGQLLATVMRRARYRQFLDGVRVP